MQKSSSCWMGVFAVTMATEKGMMTRRISLFFLVEKTFIMAGFEVLVRVLCDRRSLECPFHRLVLRVNAPRPRFSLALLQILEFFFTFSRKRP